MISASRPVRPMLAALCVLAATTLSACGGNSCIGLNYCGAPSPPPGIAFSGTAATGKALASTTVNLNCAQGAGSALTDGGGNYSVTLAVTPPCLLSVTSGATTLHSLAYTGGTFNITPETDLLLTYLAAQLGTTEAGLVANFASNAQYQQTLASASSVQAAQSAVVASLQQHYALTLAVPAFLTTPFTVGTAGIDTDLGALAAAGAIDANGMPDPAAVALVSTAGQANALAAAPSSPASGTTGAM